MSKMNRVAQAALQYSKRLSKWITWFWITYRFAILVAAGLVPNIAQYVIQMASGVDTIMMVNVGCYLVNSLGEKVIYSDRFVLSWFNKKGFKDLISSLSEQEEKDESEDEEEDSNG